MLCDFSTCFLFEELLICTFVIKNVFLLTFKQKYEFDVLNRFNI